MDNPVQARILQSMNSDLIIVGGGLNGPALALAAAQAGFTVTIIDSLRLDTRKSPKFDGRSYALAHASMRLLRGLGIWSDLADKAQPMLEIKVTDGRAGEGPSPSMMHFDHAVIEEVEAVRQPLVVHRNTQLQRLQCQFDRIFPTE